MLKTAIETFRVFNKGPQVIGSWNQLMDNLGVNPEEFYSFLEEIITHNRFQHVRISYISKNEGWFSSYKKYIRIKYKSFFFDLLFLPQEHIVLSLGNYFKVPIGLQLSFRRFRRSVLPCNKQ